MVEMRLVYSAYVTWTKRRRTATEVRERESEERENSFWRREEYYITVHLWFFSFRQATSPFYYVTCFACDLPTNNNFFCYKLKNSKKTSGSHKFYRSSFTFTVTCVLLLVCVCAACFFSWVACNLYFLLIYFKLLLLFYFIPINLTKWHILFFILCIYCYSFEHKKNYTLCHYFEDGREIF